MENTENKKPNILELESLRSELIAKTLNTSSNNLKLFLYKNYFAKIILFEQPNIEEAFVKEFLDDYLSCITRYEVWGIEPDITDKILGQIKKVATLEISREFNDEFSKEIERIENQLEKLNLILKGIEKTDEKADKAYFPLIDKEAPPEFYGIIDSITIRISKGIETDKFIIVPSEKEIEKRIILQCENSWKVALTQLSAYIKKPFSYHEIIISFDKKIGFYEGNSLGIALTLTMLEELLKFYNPEYIIKIKERSAFTGGVDEKGKILVTGEEIIKQKVKAIFFSELNTFVLPKFEETYAQFALTQLKIVYPNRNLKLIPAEDINDVLNRRDIVDIKKQKIVVRTGKFVRKNWVSAVTTVLLAILFGYLFVMDFDDNPASILADGSKVYIKNAKGRILWSEEFPLLEQMTNKKGFLDRYIKIIDMHDDRQNEILFIGRNSNRLDCLDYQKKKLWSFKFEDQVKNKEQKINKDYGIAIVDTLTYYGEKSIYLISSNGPSFASAVYRISAENGKRLPGTLWAAGHIMDAKLIDYDNDGEIEFVGVGYDNGYEDLVFFICKLDTLTKMRPTAQNYLLEGITEAEMESYLRIPKSDYDNYIELRTPRYMLGLFTYRPDIGKLIFATDIDKPQSDVQLGFEVSIGRNLPDVNIVVGSHFRIIRDSLVAGGELSLPYTDTEEYKEIIKNSILYWKDGHWVNKREVNK